jgi:hypothetical protein
MTKPVANPTRLSRLPENEDSLGVGRMFRHGRELPDEELPRLRWRLRTSQQLRAIRPRLFLKVALTVGFAFCMGGVVGAGVWPFWPWKKREPVVVASPTPAAAPSARHGKAQPVTSAPAAPALFEPVPEETTPATEPAVQAPRPVADAPKPGLPPAKRRAAIRVASLTAPTPPPAPSDAPDVTPPAPSAIAVEQALLGQAVRTLREGHDARAALALLAQHAERFPKGALAAEESILRIEALLVLGQRNEALSALDRAPLASLPNRDEQLVVRGELRAANGRWREAEQDFDHVLHERGLPAASAKVRNIQERALWGRASARSRLGDQDGARADLDLYLRHFPDGRFADPAASLLKGKP